MTQAVYQDWDPSFENVNNTAYMYNAATGTWTAILPTDTVSSAICRVGTAKLLSSIHIALRCFSKVLLNEKFT